MMSTPTGVSYDTQHLFLTRKTKFDHLQTLELKVERVLNAEEFVLSPVIRRRGPHGFLLCPETSSVFPRRSVLPRKALHFISGTRSFFIMGPVSLFLACTSDLLGYVKPAVIVGCENIAKAAVTLRQNKSDTPFAFSRHLPCGEGGRFSQEETINSVACTYNSARASAKTADCYV